MKNGCREKKHKERGPKEARHQTGLTKRKPRGRPRARPKGGSQEQLTQNEEVRGGAQGERTYKRGTQGGGTQEGGHTQVRTKEHKVDGLEEMQMKCQIA